MSLKATRRRRRILQAGFFFKTEKEKMMSRELAKTYDPKGIEDRIYGLRRNTSMQRWIIPKHRLRS